MVDWFAGHLLLRRRVLEAREALVVAGVDGGLEKFFRKKRDAEVRQQRSCQHRSVTFSLSASAANYWK
jgi:hypothetical protein